MDADLAQILALILEELKTLKAQTYTGVTPPLPASNHVPLVDGEVAVTPTGPNFKGEPRYWPTTKVFTNDKGGKSGDINYFSYLNRMMEVINPVDGKPFCTPGQWADALLPAPGSDALSFQQRADRHMHQSDWWTAEDIERQARLAERDRESNAAWVSGQQAAPTEVPISGQ